MMRLLLCAWALGVAAAASPLPSQQTALPAPFPREAVSRVFENDRVVAWEHRWTTQAATGATVDSRAAIVVMLESGALRSPTSTEDRRTFGQVYFTSVERIARETVASGAPRAIVVALK